MRVTAGLVAAVTITSLVAVPASAATKKKKPKPVPKVCNLVVDDAGDTDYNGVKGNDAVDVVGGDFASNGKKITGVIKVKGLNALDPESPFGHAYFLLFNVKGTSDLLTLTAGIYPTGNQFTYGYQAEDPNTGVNTSYSLGNAAGAIDGNTLRITADIANWPQKNFLKNGNQVTSLVAEARRVHGQRVVPSQNVGPVRVPLGGLTTTWDDAAGKKYTLGAPSCVAIPK